MDKITERTVTTTAITPTAGAAGTSTLNGATLDMSGFNAVKMQVRFGTITAGAVTSIKAQEGAASDGSDMADLAGTGQTIADTDDDKIFGIDLSQITKRYVRLVVVRGTQNAVVAEAHYQQYQARQVPVSAQGTGVTFVRIFGPAEGTP